MILSDNTDKNELQINSWTLKSDLPRHVKKTFSKLLFFSYFKIFLSYFYMVTIGDILVLLTIVGNF